MKLLIAAILLLCSASAWPQEDSAMVERRYCGQPKRMANGEIRRRADVLVAFQKIHPCPSTGKTTGACPGWSKDHVWPLAVCGCDSVSNLQWLKNEIKSCEGVNCKDRWERVVYSCKHGEVK
jgi:hypothetical protein